MTGKSDSEQNELAFQAFDLAKADKLGAVLSKEELDVYTEGQAELTQWRSWYANAPLGSAPAKSPTTPKVAATPNKIDFSSLAGDLASRLKDAKITTRALLRKHLDDEKEKNPFIISRLQAILAGGSGEASVPASQPKETWCSRDEIVAKCKISKNKVVEVLKNGRGIKSERRKRKGKITQTFALSGFRKALKRFEDKKKRERREKKKTAKKKTKSASVPKDPSQKWLTSSELATATHKSFYTIKRVLDKAPKDSIRERPPEKTGRKAIVYNLSDFKKRLDEASSPAAAKKKKKAAKKKTKRKATRSKKKAVAEKATSGDSSSTQEEWVTRQELTKKFKIRYGKVAEIIRDAPKGSIRTKHSKRKGRAVTLVLISTFKAQHDKVRPPTRTKKKKKKASKKSSKKKAGKKKSKVTEKTPVDKLKIGDKNSMTHFKNRHGVKTAGDIAKLDPEKVWHNARPLIDKVAKLIKA